MAQKVLKVGSSAAVTIPKKSLEELGLKVGDKVVVETDSKKKSFTVKPVVKMTKRQQHIAEMTLDFIEEYREDLEALAKR